MVIERFLATEFGEKYLKVFGGTGVTLRLVKEYAIAPQVGLITPLQEMDIDPAIRQPIQGCQGASRHRGPLKPHTMGCHYPQAMGCRQRPANYWPHCRTCGALREQAAVEAQRLLITSGLHQHFGAECWYTSQIKFKVMLQASARRRRRSPHR
ncbi:hypothetical protein D3C76_1340430 [compost metagenome]